MTSGSASATEKWSWSRAPTWPARPPAHRHRAGDHFCDPQKPWQRGTDEDTNGLWDRVNEQIASDDSGEIMRFLGSDAWDGVVGDPAVDLAPRGLRPEVDTLNAWLAAERNDAVYVAAQGHARATAGHAPIVAGGDWVHWLVRSGEVAGATTERTAGTPRARGGGLEPITRHDGRPTFASTALAAACNRERLPAFCGRSSITVMMDVHDRLFRAASRRLPSPDGYIRSFHVMQVIQGIPVWGTPDEGALRQMHACAAHGNVAGAALMADHHLGYSQPIGGVIAYRDAVSPSGVGYDIGCGVMAVRTDMTYGAVRGRRATIADDIARSIKFGVGSGDGHERDHAIFEDPAWRHLPYDQRTLERTARQQLGSVGSGNHYVDLLVEEGDAAQPIWVAAHFGSRGFGHRTATGFLNVAAGRPWNARPARESMDAPPTLIEHAAEPGLFDHYLEAMRLAGDYARAGRELVVDQVLRILGATATAAIHNHHNYAWLEEHGGERVWVVRKGATPAFPGQQGFVGGSMGDIAAVVEGVDSDESVLGLRSTVHGAGRVMSRGQAKGSRPKRNLETGRQRVRRPGLITRQMMSDATQGVEIRGGDVDESPHVYRKLAGVLDAHAGSIAVKHVLRPVVVVMADARVRDSVPTD